jgi:hypothetical protein
LWFQQQVPAWLDGSPGGPISLWCDVQPSGRVASIRLNIAVGVVGQITVTVRAGADEFVYTAPNLTTPDVGYDESKNVPTAMGVDWVDDQPISDGLFYTGPVRDGSAVTVEIGWVNPDGVMTTEQRAQHEANRGGG